MLVIQFGLQCGDIIGREFGTFFDTVLLAVTQETAPVLGSRRKPHLSPFRRLSAGLPFFGPRVGP